MGNCLNPQSSKKHAADTDSDDDFGDDWGSSSTKMNGGVVSGKITEVKIKITKKQLEQLLGKASDARELRVEEVLAQLLSGHGRGYEVHQHKRPWSPALQSIPEVN